MSELVQELIQQRNARPVDGTTLELMGKKAAAMWQEGNVKTLSEAVVETVKHACLSPEQVRRVIEFTNVDAYQREFRKEGTEHKIVDFGEGGPANPSVVFQDLNDGGGGTVFDRGTLDYNTPPTEKVSFCEQDEKAFDELFKVAAPDLPEENPFGEAIRLWEKLSAEHQHLNAQVSGLEIAHEELVERLFGHVKQAALDGHSLSEIAHIWSSVTPDDIFVKLAFRRMYEPLMTNGVFDHETLIQSMEKISQPRMPNSNHPLVKDFIDYCSTLEKMAELRDLRDELANAVGDMTVFLKAAAGGIVGTTLSAGKKGLEYAGRGGEMAGELLFGQGVNKNLARRVGQGAALAGTALAANEAKRELEATPPGQMAVRAGRALSSAIPGTEGYYQRQYELAARAGGF